VKPERFYDRFEGHTVKVLPAGPEVNSYFIFRTGTTTDAVNMVSQKGRLYMSSPTIGTFALEPYAPDVMLWLRRNIDDTRALLDAIPDNLKPHFACVRPPEVDQLANLLEGAISTDEDDEEEYKDLLVWLYDYRDELSPIPATVLADRLEYSRFFEDGLVSLDDMQGLLTHTDVAYTFVAMLRRFVDVLEQRAETPWEGWEQ